MLFIQALSFGLQVPLTLLSTWLMITYPTTLIVPVINSPMLSLRTGIIVQYQQTCQFRTFRVHFMRVGWNKYGSVPLSSANRLNPSLLICDSSINSSGSVWSLLIQRAKLSRAQFECSLDWIIDLKTGIKSICSLGRNQRSYLSPNRWSNGHNGAPHFPRSRAWAGCTTSAWKTFAPSEDGCALWITNSSKPDMKASAFIQAWLVALILIWRIFGASWGQAVRYDTNSPKSQPDLLHIWSKSHMKSCYKYVMTFHCM